jgi:hypothetical protein
MPLFDELTFFATTTTTTTTTEATSILKNVAKAAYFYNAHHVAPGSAPANYSFSLACQMFYYSCRDSSFCSFGFVIVYIFAFIFAFFVVAKMCQFIVSFNLHAFVRFCFKKEKIATEEDPKPRTSGTKVNQQNKKNQKIKTNESKNNKEVIFLNYILVN